MSQKVIIGLMGPGETATDQDMRHAFKIGQAIAEQGWITLTGGRNCGVMDSACRGAKERGGMTIGILPGVESAGLSRYVDIPIITGMNSARNSINALTCQVIIVVGMGPGTASEVSLAVKAGRQVILYRPQAGVLNFFKKLSPELVSSTRKTTETTSLIELLLSDHNGNT